MDVRKHIFTSLMSPNLSTNESFFPAYDYHYDSTDNSNTLNRNVGDPQHLAILLERLFSKMSDNKTLSETPASNPLMNSTSLTISSTSLYSYETILPSPETNADSYYLPSLISLWFVLIINPIVILFGVTGNLVATYILIRCNIAKLPVSFYTIMLNISDTLNLLIPVLIFWLDNCINRTPERGYFRDRSNFFCKALMCPDQLFAALSAWYMCAISFNRWYCVCRPSKYFFRTATNFFSNSSVRLSSNTSEKDRSGQKKHLTSLTNQTMSTFNLFCFPWNCCSCLTNNMKFRRHLQAFRSIALITLVGFLFCLYPIFMHELHPIMSTSERIFDSKKKITRINTIVYQRCYYSQKHKYAYDIIGIILSCLLHILPLTFVAVMNLMIIIRLRQRQKLMTVTANVQSSQAMKTNKKKSLIELKTKRNLYTNETTFEKHHRQITVPAVLNTTRKDQSTSTDLSFHSTAPQLALPLNTTIPSKRHYSRDRTITIMLVSVALSYLILTLPYRLFWSYNVYTKRMHPEKLKSSIFLLKMHYTDHVLRTIRNIHYGTNFIFFIFLSRTFRRKFRQIFIEKFLQKTRRLFNYQTSDSDPNQLLVLKTHHHQRRKTTKHHCKQPDACSRTTVHETSSHVADIPLQKDEIIPIIKLEYSNLARYDGD